MNRIELHEGGHPADLLAELLYMQSAYKEAFEGLARGFGNAILNGCRLDTIFGQAIMIPGFVSINGEVYYHAGQSWDTSVLTEPVFVPVETLDTGAGLSPVLYGDGQFKDVHFTRRVVIEQNGSQPVKVALREMKDFGFTYGGQDWMEVKPNGSGVASAAEYSASFEPITSGMLTNNYENLKIRKNGDMLELTGCCMFENFVGSPLPTVFNLPDRVQSLDGARLIPQKRQYIHVVAGQRSGNLYSPQERAVVAILPTGAVGLFYTSYSGSGDFILQFNNRVPLF